MPIILTSCLKTYVKDEIGNKTYIPLDNENFILDNIKNNLKNTNRAVYVANDPNNFEENDMRFETAFESFDLTGINFTEKLLLDSRNKNDAKQILLGADLILLSGGKCLCQNKFFKEIGLNKILKKYDGLVISISAGSMNLGKVVANFPEENADLVEPRWLKGLAFYNKIIIPHFDGENIKYQIDCEEVDVVNDYILPFSFRKSFIGIPNGSYILIDNKKPKYFGDFYKICKGKVSIIKVN